MANCFPFIKYFYICVLFVFSFMCLFNQTNEMIGFGSLVAIQGIFLLLLVMDIMQDGNRGGKSLIITTLTSPINIPIYWVLLAGVGLQFASAVLMVITTAYLYKKFQAIKMSQSNRLSVQRYKSIFVIVTVLLMLLTYMYTTFYSGGYSSTSFSGSYKIIITMSFFAILGLSSLNVYYANSLSNLIQTTTDG